MTLSIPPRMTSRGWLLRPAIAVLVAVSALATRIVMDGIGLSSLVAAGTDLVDGAAAPDELVIRDEGTGYDGQYYYRLSRDPFTSRQTDFGILLDQPAYRQQRILLPLLAHALNRATGVSTLVWIPVINLVAIALATAASERILARSGANRWWSLAVGLGPGVVLAARLDLAEPLAISLGLTGLALWRQRPIPAAAALAAAVLARETTLVMAAGIGFYVVWGIARAAVQQRKIPVASTRRLVLALIPLGVFVGWNLWLTSHWGESAWAAASQRAGVPLVAVVDSLFDVDVASEWPVMEWGWLLVRLLLVTFVLVAVLLVRSSTVAPEVKWSFGVALVLVLSLEGLYTPQSSTRATIEAFTLGVLVVAAAPGRGSWWAMLVPPITYLSFNLTP